jgi:serine phosphatase RsbU (regulator of sigma subunit)/anti-sigma regulatory factor (Ser/Thr protein kinase)/PAS domain-containing protein
MSDLLDRKPAISFQNALIVAIVIVVSYAAITILLKDNEELRLEILNVLTIITDLFAVLCLLYAARRSRYNKTIYFAWFMIFLAQLSWTIGDIIWMILEVGFHEVNPFPSAADVGYLGFFPLFTLGVLLLPNLPLSSGERRNVLMDIGIIMIASSILFWILLIYPTIIENLQESTITLILTIAYPVGDFLLLFALIELLFRRFKSVDIEPILLLMASIFFMLLTNYTQMSQYLSNTWIAGGIATIGWIIACVLLGLAGASQANLGKSNLRLNIAKSEIIQFTWPVYLPYFCMGLTYLILVWSLYHPLPISDFALSIATGLIIGLFVVRQVFVLRENVSLYKAKVQEVNQRITAENEVKKLNEELEDRVLKRTAELELANKAIQNSQQLMSNIIDFLPDAIMAVDLAGKVMIWNKEMERLTKVESEHMIGKDNYEHSIPFYGFRRPVLVDMLLKPYEEFEAEYFGFKRIGNAVVGEVFIPNFGLRGSYLLAKASKLYDASGEVIGAIESVRDMTDRRQMEQKLERTRAELQIAANIQKSFIPESTPVVPGYDIAAITIPAMEVGGDFFDFIRLSDNRYGVVIADVAGKGVPAAIFMALSRTIIRANASNQKKISKVLSNTNKMIESESTANMFVTLLYGIIGNDGLSFRYSNAGHPPPLVIRSAKCMIEEEKVLGIALGLKKEADYLENTIRISPGDMIVLYTDGVTEAMDNQGELYGQERLMRLMSGLCQKSAQFIIKRIIEDIKSFSGNIDQHDDLTLVVIKAVEQSGNPQRIILIAHENEIPALLSRIEESMRQSGFGHEEILNFQLAVEEACVNIIKHGYHGDEGSISITLEPAANSFTAIVEDEAPQFDPTKFDSPNLVGDVETRPIGGLGIHLIKSLTDELTYEYVEGKNRLSLMKRKL